MEKTRNAGLPDVDARSLKEAARESLVRAGEFPSDVPDEVTRILEWPDVVPWDQFQRMRSRIERTDRMGRRGLTETRAGHQAENLAPTRSAFNDKLDEIEASAGQIMSPEQASLYRQARRATAKFKEDFSRKAPLVNGIEEYAESIRVGHGILRAKKPLEEARRARRIFEQSPQGLGAVQDAAIQSITGTAELVPTRAKRALANLRADGKREAMEELLGAEKFEMLENVLEKASIVSIGKQGSSRAIHSTGSAVGDGAAFLSPSEAFSRPAGVGDRIVGAAIQAAFRSRTGLTVGRILREAELDPELAKTLLEMPTDRAVEGWLLNWNKLVNRSVQRTAVREGLGEDGSTPSGGVR